MSEFSIAPKLARQIRLLLLDIDGVLSDGRITLGVDEELKSYHAQDGLGVTLARAAGLEVGILTGRHSQTVARRAAELKMDHLVQGRPDKLQAFAELCAERGLKPEETAYMGDDWIDLPLLERVGLAACPVDARPEVRDCCSFVSPFPGGRGAVRDFVDELLKARGQFSDLLERYRAGHGDAASGGKQ